MLLQLQVQLFRYKVNIRLWLSSDTLFFNYQKYYLKTCTSLSNHLNIHILNNQNLSFDCSDIRVNSRTRIYYNF